MGTGGLHLGHVVGSHGAARHLQAAQVVQHQVEQGAEAEDARQQARHPLHGQKGEGCNVWRARL